MYIRYYRVAGITIRFDAELRIDDKTFAPKFKLFEVDGFGSDNVHLIHHFSLPEPKDYGRPACNKSPWAIYRRINRFVRGEQYPPKHSIGEPQQ